MALSEEESKKRKRKRDRDRMRRLYATPEGRAKLLAAASRYSASPKGRATSKVWQLSNKYRLSQKSFERWKSHQGHVCAVCREVPDKFHVDHDHDTDVVRGLLCAQCNVGLGMFRDLPARLRAAARYLDHPQTPCISTPVLLPDQQHPTEE